jgi:ketosteroid isomerase-like protein
MSAKGRAIIMTPARMSKLETAIRTALKYHEAYNRHDVSAMMSLVADDCVLESSGPTPDGATIIGKHHISRLWEKYFAERQSATRQIEDVFSLGIRCVLRWRGEWTDLDGVPRAIRGVDIFQVKEGKITEALSYVKG